MRRLSFLLITLALGGCAAAGTAEKGVEDDALDGKADSFGNPTEHGQLRFGVASHATITESELYHSWTFELSAASDVTIRLSSHDRNLDTIVYLYHRDSDDQSWGGNIGKYDDDPETGSLQETIVLAGDDRLGAGQYRIKVKGFKRFHRGPFSVEATCAGAGCEGTDRPGDIAVPAETGFSHGCVQRLWDAVGSPVVSASAYGVHPDTREGLDRSVLIATAHYAELSDWSEYIDEEERAEFTFGVEHWDLENGAIVEMSDGGDESTTDYAFDQAGNLLAYYVHNQSPWTGYFCGSDDDEAADEPFEDCLSAWMNSGPRSGTVVEGTESWHPDEPNDEIDALMQAAIDRYIAEQNGGDSNLSIRITYSDWESPDGNRGVDLLLDGGDDVADVSYTVVQTWDDPIIVFESSENDDEGPHMICVQ